MVEDSSERSSEPASCEMSRPRIRPTSAEFEFSRALRIARPPGEIGTLYRRRSGSLGHRRRYLPTTWRLDVARKFSIAGTIASCNGFVYRSRGLYTRIDEARRLSNSGRYIFGPTSATSAWDGQVDLQRERHTLRKSNASHA